MSEVDLLTEENSYQIAARMQRERTEGTPVTLVRDRKGVKVYPTRPGSGAVAGPGLFSKMPTSEVKRVKALFFKKK